MISRSDVARQLEYGIRTGFLNGTRTYTPLRAAFCGEQTSSGAFEHYADMGDVPWPVQNSGQLGAGGTDGHAEVTGAINSGHAITVIGGEERAMTVYNVDWEISVAVTHNAINDVRVGNLENWARDAARNFEKHKDYLAFSALNAGDGTTYGNCYDHLTFFNNNHVDPGAEYQTVQDNIGNTALSLDAYEAARVAAAKFLDSRGQPIGLTHSLLIVPPDLERTASNIITNREDYGTTNRATNPYAAGGNRFLVAPGGWLDSTAWIIVVPDQTAKPVYLQNRQNAELAIWDVEGAGDGGMRYFKWHARYQVFYGDWRLAYMGRS